MKKTAVLALVLTAFLTLSGCAGVATPVGGILYTNVSAPIDAGDSGGGQAKVGSASAVSILGIIAIGDAGIERAAKDAGITKIHHVDYNGTSILGIFSKFTVYVYGE